VPETENHIRTEGSVVAVSIDGKHRFSKMPRSSISLTKGHGIEGDAHYGPFVRHRYLARRDPTAANLRQVHLIASELFDALRTRGFEVRPGAVVSRLLLRRNQENVVGRRERPRVKRPSTCRVSDHYAR
jgi:hypothetical protein